MGMPKIASTLVASLAMLGQTSALDPIIMKGQKFFYENGTQFYMKGVAYQQDSAAGGGVSTGGSSVKSDNFHDPLANAKRCAQDVPILKQMGTNVIRTYAIDPTADHSQCMKLLEEAGIYVVSDLSQPKVSINRDDPTWDVTLYERYTAVVDELMKYDNVIGFFAGNEVSNNKTNTAASAFVKAAVRDTKKHIKDTKKRWAGVGYAANDDADIRAEIAHYFNCGDQDAAIDFWGYNIYSWCGKSTFAKSGYSNQVDFFQNYSVPVFFAEYGCNTQGGADARIWEETAALYSDEMTGSISGGIVYMYFQEENDYGLVEVTNGKASLMDNGKRLASAVKKADPSSTSMDAYSPTNKPAECPNLSSTWKASNVLPPTPDSETCECMFAAATCVASDDLDTDDYGDIFDYICAHDKDACNGIKANTSTGVYGPFGMCNSTQKLAHVLSTYYANQKQASDACDFKGSAQVVSPSSSDGQCKKILSSASSAISFAATATAGNAAAGTGGSDDESAANFVSMHSAFTLGNVAVGLYAVMAMAVGAAMVTL